MAVIRSRPHLLSVLNEYRFVIFNDINDVNSVKTLICKTLKKNPVRQMKYFDMIAWIFFYWLWKYSANENLLHVTLNVKKIWLKCYVKSLLKNLRYIVFYSMLYFHKHIKIHDIQFYIFITLNNSYNCIKFNFAAGRIYFAWFVKRIIQKCILWVLLRWCKNKTFYPYF